MKLSTLLAFAFFSAVAAGCSGEAAEVAPPTADELEQIYEAARGCFEERGFDADLAMDGNFWSFTFSEDPGTLVYEACTRTAERAQLAFLRSQIPEGEELAEMTLDFEECLSKVGVDVTFDTVERSDSQTLADATVALGYALDDPSVADDPRFSSVLDCFEEHELLFPSRFGSG